MSMDLFPAHLPVTPEFKTSDEAAANVRQAIGSNIMFHPEMPEAQRLAHVNSIYQELLRSKEAGGPVPTTITYKPGSDPFMRRTDYSAWNPLTWGGSGAKGGKARDSADSGIWINSDRPASDSLDRTMRHELGHVADGDKIWAGGSRKPLSAEDEPVGKLISPYAGTSRVEFIAEVYANATNGEPIPPGAMEMYERMGGPPIPRMLPRREPPKGTPREPSQVPGVLDRMIKILRGG